MSGPGLDCALVPLPLGFLRLCRPGALCFQPACLDDLQGSHSKTPIAPQKGGSRAGRNWVTWQGVSSGAGPARATCPRWCLAPGEVTGLPQHMRLGSGDVMLALAGPRGAPARAAAVSPCALGLEVPSSLSQGLCSVVGLSRLSELSRPEMSSCRRALGEVAAAGQTVEVLRPKEQAKRGGPVGACVWPSTPGWAFSPSAGTVCEGQVECVRDKWRLVWVQRGCFSSTWGLL